MHTIDWRLIEREGATYLVSITHDTDADPRTDGDWAGPADIAAWLADDWCYVNVTVSRAPDDFACLGAVVWGDLPDARQGLCGWDYVLDEVFPDLVSELKGN